MEREEGKKRSRNFTNGNEHVADLERPVGTDIVGK